MKQLTTVAISVFLLASFSCLPVLSTARSDDPLLSRSRESWCKTYGTGVGEKIFSSIDLIKKTSKPPLDMDYLRSMLKSRTLSSNAFKLLDDAMARESLLDKSDRLASEVERLSKSPLLQAEFLKPRAELSRVVRCRMRTIVGVARAGVAVNFAHPDSRAYCSQAMESSIDSLRDAVKLAGDIERSGMNAELPSSVLTDLRTRLLEIWDRSQKEASVEPVREMDLEETVLRCLWPVQKNGPLKAG